MKFWPDNFGPISSGWFVTGMGVGILVGGLAMPWLPLVTIFLIGSVVLFLGQVFLQRATRRVQA